MRHATLAQHAPSPLVSILFRVLSALNCGAVLLDSQKTIIRLSDRAQAHLGEALTTNKGRLCATDRDPVVFGMIGWHAGTSGEPSTSV